MAYHHHLVRDLTLRLQLILDALNPMRPIRLAPSIKTLSQRATSYFVQPQTNPQIQTFRNQLSEFGLADGLPAELYSELADSRTAREKFLETLIKENPPPPKEPPIRTKARQHAKRHFASNEKQLDLAAQLVLQAELILLKQKRGHSLSIFDELSNSMRSEKRWREEVANILDTTIYLTPCEFDGQPALRAQTILRDCTIIISPTVQDSLLTNRDIEIIATACIQIICGILKYDSSSSDPNVTDCGKRLLVEGSLKGWVTLAKFAEQQHIDSLTAGHSDEEWSNLLLASKTQE